MGDNRFTCCTSMNDCILNFTAQVQITAHKDATIRSHQPEN